MRVFLTGATGFVGSRVLQELLAAGHDVTGNTRSDTGREKLARAGATAWFGDLDDPASLARGAEDADAVIHTAFDHDFSRFVENCEKDRRVILALGEVLAGSDRPLIITSGVIMGAPAPGEPAREDVFDRDSPNLRRLSEIAGEEVAARGGSVAVVRLPQVHNKDRQGLASPLIALARDKGLSAYVGDGLNRWSAGHVDDVATVYALALEHHAPDARWHAVGEDGVTLHDIATAIGNRLHVSTTSLDGSDIEGHFGPMTAFVGMDMSASSEATRKRLGWNPAGSGLVDDIRNSIADGRAA